MHPAPRTTFGRLARTSCTPAPLLPSTFQPDRLMPPLEMLRISMNSSNPPFGPRVRNSWMTRVVETALIVVPSAAAKKLARMTRPRTRARRRRSCISDAAPWTGETTAHRVRRALKLRLRPDSTKAEPLVASGNIPRDATQDSLTAQQHAMAPTCWRHGSCVWWAAWQSGLLAENEPSEATARLETDPGPSEAMVRRRAAWELGRLAEDEPSEATARLETDPRTERSDGPSTRRLGIGPACGSRQASAAGAEIHRRTEPSSQSEDGGPPGN